MGRNPDRKRHGARNQAKCKDFCKWLFQTFDRRCFDQVLDVAGGNGELAGRLTMCHHAHVTLVDPRPADVQAVFEKRVVPKLPNKWQTRLAERVVENPSFVESTLSERFSQLVSYFTDDTVEEDPDLKLAVQDCTLLVGLHADAATECVVDVALKYQKPFVVVPCCVFPNLFRERRIERDGQVVPVRSHEDFCEFLRRKDERLETTILPFEGRNVAIYWTGPESEGPSSTELTSS